MEDTGRTNRRHGARPKGCVRRRRWLAPALVLGAVLASCGSSTAPSPGTSSTASTTSPPAVTGPTPTTATTRPPTTTTTTTAPTPTTTSPTTTSPTTTVPAAATLSLGSSGPAVLALQQRLTALGYWLGTPDGTFGDSTEQAVYALQKAAGISRDGVVGPVTEAALAGGVVPTPRSTTGYVVEVDLARDLLMVVDDGQVRDVLNTSTGGGYVYTDDGVTATADTPTGHFDIYREVDGMVVDSLGELWRPKFFDGGFAIHGDSYVPPEPVSHGCVRVSNEAIDWIWSDDIMPIGTAVWVY